MKIFVIGVGPLPFYCSPIPQNSISEGTWQMVYSLLHDGHQVRVATMEFGQREDPQVEYLKRPEEVSPNLEHQYYPEPLRDSSRKIARQVQIALAAFQPDAVVSAGSMIAAWVTTQLKHRLPLWYDIKGAFLPELQLRMDHPDAEAVFNTFAVYKHALLRGDRFSAVTERQAHMLMGELGMVGRLNPQTLRDELVTVKPTGIDPDSPKRLAKTGRIRGRLCTEDTFVLFSSGGFNTWQDTRMFFRTVEKVLQAEPQAEFVCIGGGIGGHVDGGYEAFRNWVGESPVRERFHLEGWVPQDQVIEYESEADLGINCDLEIPESRYGDRSRFLSWMARGVGVATTPLSQPSELLVEKGMAVGLPGGDSSGACEAILAAIRNPDAHRERIRKAEQFARTEWSFLETTKHLRAWAADPKRAGDNQSRFEKNEIDRQYELASYELSLDYLYFGEERQSGKKTWKRVHHELMKGWPWPDGRRLRG
jgi:glycosyltransferase involved in cell wall biosynthesis